MDQGHDGLRNSCRPILRRTCSYALQGPRSRIFGFPIQVQIYNPAGVLFNQWFTRVSVDFLFLKGRSEVDCLDAMDDRDDSTKKTVDSSKIQPPDRSCPAFGVKKMVSKRIKEATTFADLGEEAVISGPLLRRGYFNGWRERFVELRGNTLSYGLAEGGLRLRFLQLGPRSRCEDIPLRHFCFYVSDETGTKIMYFAAASAAEKEAWMEAIHTALSLLRLARKKSGKRRVIDHIASGDVSSTESGVAIGRKQSNEMSAQEFTNRAREYAVNQYRSRPKIYVKIIRARNLKAKDIGGTSDPYVNMTVGASTARTTTRMKDLNPEWGMVFTFDWDSSMRYMKLEVWDEDYGSADDFLGRAVVPLLWKKNGDTSIAWYPLGKRSSRSNISGEIEIELTFQGQPTIDGETEHAHYLWSFFREVQKLPEFSLNLASRSDGVAHLRIDAPRSVSVFTDNSKETTSNCAASASSGAGVASNGSATMTAVSKKRYKAEGFPWNFPPIETEIVEDVSMRVHLVSQGESSAGNVSSPGVLFLTNYRLIFLSMDRINRKDADEYKISIGKAPPNPDMSTSIPLSSVVSATLSAEMNHDGAFGAVFEVIKIRTADCRSVSFVFKEDVAVAPLPFSGSGTGIGSASSASSGGANAGLSGMGSGGGPGAGAAVSGSMNSSSTATSGTIMLAMHIGKAFGMFHGDRADDPVTVISQRARMRTALSSAGDVAEIREKLDALVASLEADELALAQIEETEGEEGERGEGSDPVAGDDEESIGREDEQEAAEAQQKQTSPVSGSDKTAAAATAMRRASAERRDSLGFGVRNTHLPERMQMIRNQAARKLSMLTYASSENDASFTEGSASGDVEGEGVATGMWGGVSNSNRSSAAYCYSSGGGSARYPPPQEGERSHISSSMRLVASERDETRPERTQRGDGDGNGKAGRGGKECGRGGGTGGEGPGGICLTKLTISWLKLLSAHCYSIEAMDSVEGPPAHRILNRLKFLAINRDLARKTSLSMHKPLLDMLRYACGQAPTFRPTTSSQDLLRSVMHPFSSFDARERDSNVSQRNSNPAVVVIAATASDGDEDVPNANSTVRDSDYAATAAVADSTGGNRISAIGALVPSLVCGCSGSGGGSSAEKADQQQDVESPTTHTTDEREHYEQSSGQVQMQQEETSAESRTTHTSTAGGLGINTDRCGDIDMSIMNPLSINRLPLGWSEDMPVPGGGGGGGFARTAGMNGTSASLRESQKRLQKTDTLLRELSLPGLEAKIRSSPELLHLYTRLLCNLESGAFLFDTTTEFKRMGLPNMQWRLTSINNNYELCSTYPAVLAVPAEASDELLTHSAAFRSKGRLPTLCWRSLRNGSTICRASQPLVGLSNNRSSADEELLQTINACTQRPQDTDLEYDRPLVIADARPFLNARANQAAGKGVELEKHYGNVQVEFMDIPNIHAVRKSLEQIEEATFVDAEGSTSWHRSVESSNWLTNIRKILLAVMRIVRHVDKEGLSVLVHCSDGWDRTAQLTSLSMLLLDEYYRTLEGFIVLVEKEWVSFGHKFADRLGLTGEGWRDEERSPVFFQFLDCVYQCMHQLPDAFQFNEDLLLFIAQHLSSGWFGNFAFNCQREMLGHFYMQGLGGRAGAGGPMDAGPVSSMDSGVEGPRWEKNGGSSSQQESVHDAISIWTAVLGNRARFTNRTYQPQQYALLPVVNQSSVVVWAKWFLRWQRKVWSFAWVNDESHKVEMRRIQELHAAAHPNFALVRRGISGHVGGGSTVWVDDLSAPVCHACERRFTIFLRRHHCRNCGQIFCFDCSSQLRIVPTVSSVRPTRCCGECAKKIDMREYRFSVGRSADTVKLALGVSPESTSAGGSLGSTSASLQSQGNRSMTASLAAATAGSNLLSMMLNESPGGGSRLSFSFSATTAARQSWSHSTSPVVISTASPPPIAATSCGIPSLVQ